MISTQTPSAVSRQGIRNRSYSTRRNTLYALVVSFGDVFLLDEFLKSSSLIKAVDAIGYRNTDTLHALLAYYILSPLACCHAEDWWELTYAKYHYPKAQISSQRISDALTDIGSEDAKRGGGSGNTAVFLKCQKTTQKTKMRKA